MELAGQVLIAMPSMGDPRFARSVILVVAHGPDGAMGLIVNKPDPDAHLAGLLDQLDIDTGPTGTDEPVYVGGPVETGRGFVLHDAGYSSDAPTVEMPGGFRMTATLDVLEDIAAGRGPERRLVCLGYSGWAPGQLEAEISRDGWLVAEPTADLIFDTDNGAKWAHAMKLLGIDGLNLASGQGRA